MVIAAPAIGAPVAAVPVIVCVMVVPPTPEAGVVPDPPPPQPVRTIDAASNRGTDNFVIILLNKDFDTRHSLFLTHSNSSTSANIPQSYINQSTLIKLQQF
jgi:hypothetical protein